MLFACHPYCVQGTELGRGDVTLPAVHLVIFYGAHDSHGQKYTYARGQEHVRSQLQPMTCLNREVHSRCLERHIVRAETEYCITICQVIGILNSCLHAGLNANALINLAAATKAQRQKADFELYNA
eukprot:4153909-Pleurochrysis_carterae.AAC.2